jgi:hypothetical protein
VIPALERWRQEDFEFKTCLSYCSEDEGRKEGKEERRKGGRKEGREEEEEKKEGKKEEKRVRIWALWFMSIILATRIWRI